MTALFNIGIPILTGIVLLSAVIFLVRALSRRVKATGPLTYGVGRQEARQAMQVDLVRSMALTIVGLILLGVFGLRPLPADLEPQAETTPVSSPTATLPAALPTTVVATNIPLATLTTTSIITPEATPTNPLLPPTATTTAEPTETPTSEPVTAVVNSPNGLWLRDAPGTDSNQIENLLDGTVLILLPGLESANDLEWQEVRAPSGIEGWVAVEFITYQ